MDTTLKKLVASGLGRGPREARTGRHRGGGGGAGLERWRRSVANPKGLPLVTSELGRAIEDIRTGRFERTLAGLAAAGALVTTAEIFTSHDSASFGNKMMWLPVAIVPTMIPAGIAAVLSRRAAKTVLPLASALVVANGLQGTYLHARGILQKPGGASNLRYNVEMGPPAFAPLLATMVGGMGLLAALLRREGAR